MASRSFGSQQGPGGLASRQRSELNDQINDLRNDIDAGFVAIEAEVDSVSGAAAAQLDATSVAGNLTTSGGDDTISITVGADTYVISFGLADKTERTAPNAAFVNGGGGLYDTLVGVARAIWYGILLLEAAGDIAVGRVTVGYEDGFGIGAGIIDDGVGGFLPATDEILTPGKIKLFSEEDVSVIVGAGLTGFSVAP